MIVTPGDIADDDLTEAETTEVTFQKQRKQKTFSKKKFKGNSIMSSISTNVENQTRTNAKLNIDNNIPPLPDINCDADEESEGQYQSIVDTSMDDDWEDWEECDFLSTDNDSADEWLP